MAKKKRINERYFIGSNWNGFVPNLCFFFESQKLFFLLFMSMHAEHILHSCRQEARFMVVKFGSCLAINLTSTNTIRHMRFF